MPLIKSSFFKATLSIALVSAIILSVPTETTAQKRQRAKTKAKTGAVSKQNKPQTSAEAKKRQAEAQKEIKLTEEQIRQNEADVKKRLAELGKIEESISVSNKKIGELNTKLSNLNGEINSLETGIAKNEKDLEMLRAEYIKAVKKMRVTKKNKSTLAFIFSSKSVNQAMRRMRYLREFSAWRGRQTEEINAKTADLKNQRDALAKAKEEQSTALSLQKKAAAQLASQQKEQENVVAELKKNGAALQAHLKKKQAEASELNNMVSQLIAQEQKKAAEEEAKRKAEEEAMRKAAEEEEARKQQMAQNSSASSSSNAKAEKSKSSGSTDYADARKRKPRNTETKQPSATPSKTSDTKGSSFSDMKGKLPYPSTGSFLVTSRFGRQSMPDLPDVVYDNPGIDAESDAGAAARAVFNGKVSGVYLLPGYNTVVIVNHGSYYTVYGNISSPSVKTGDNVDAGSILGKLALNDDDTSHSMIHFEVWKNREKLNPQDWLH